MASISPHPFFSPSSINYQRHQPEKTLLYKLIQENLLDFYHQLENEQEKTLPHFVKKEFEEFLKCGLLACGFLRLQCQSCKQERLLAFSCKRRGFCPSCGARRMAESAAHLVDEVFPHKPLRQWVLSFPFPLRLLFAKDSQLITDVLNLVHRAISTCLIKKSGLKKKSGAKTGSVTFIQRFGGSLNLNIHFHIIYLDGVYTFDQEKTRFHFISPPTQLELDNLLKTIAQRTLKLLKKRSLIVKDEGAEHQFLNIKDTEAIDHIHNSSLSYRIAFGKYQGRKTLTLRTAPQKQHQKQKPFLSEYSSFSLHAGVFCPAHNRKKLEHLCRYISRPSLSEARLSLNVKGQVVYKLKTAYRNGTTHIVLSPLDLLSRLASLVPRPRVHLIRFHGVFAPHCKYRSLVTPTPAEKINETSHKEPKQQKKSYSMGWAKMLKRVFDMDIQTCSKCGGQIKIISSIHNPQIIKRILTHLGEEHRVPELSPSRGPPEEEESLVST